MEQDRPTIVRVAVLDRRHYVRAGFQLLLQDCPDLTWVGAVSAPLELRRLRAERGVQVVVVTDAGDAAVVAAAVEDVATVVVTPSDAVRPGHGETVVGNGMTTSWILRRIRSAIADHPSGHPDKRRRAYRSDEDNPVLARDARQRSPREHKVLTPQQLVVLHEVSDGRSTTAIAKRLGLSPKTIEHHTQQLFARLGVNNRAEAVAVAFRLGVLPAQRPAGVGP